MKMVLHSAGLVALCLYGAACATARPSPAARRASRAWSESDRSNPQSEPVLRSLGIAYYKSGKLTERERRARAGTKAQSSRWNGGALPRPNGRRTE